MSESPIAEVLSCPSLPTLPTVAVALLELTRDPDVDLEDIEKLVQSDQGLANKVLRTVNSSFYGLAQPCSSIRRALAYLGLNAVKSLVLGFSLVELGQDLGGDDERDFSLVRFWRRAIYSATAARQLAITTGSGDPDEAFTCGMFQDMGMLAAFLALKDRYAEVIRLAGHRHDRLVFFERESFGFDHGQVGAALAEKWKLPELLTECVRHHHRPEASRPTHRQIVHVVALGGMAAAALGEDAPERHVADLVRMTRTWLGRDVADVEGLLTSVAIGAHDLAKVLDQPIGDMPDIQQTMSQAGELLAAFQIETQRQVEALQQKQADLTVKVETDALTGIANRAKFNALAAELFERATTDAMPFALLFIDADHFKSVNDKHGHQTGDAVLVEIARRVAEAVADAGVACRYGGEEFAVLLRDVTEQQAIEVAERVRLALANAPIELQHVAEAPDELAVTVSVGLTAHDPTRAPQAAGIDEVIAAADRAVYRAKEEGRNRVRVAAPPDSSGRARVPDVRSSTATAGMSGGVCHVLLVESDPLAATLLIALFRRQPDTKVSWITTCGKALRWLEHVENGLAAAPALALCTLDLPDGSGLDVIRRIRRSRLITDLPTYVLHETADGARHRACLDAGATMTFTKSDIARDLREWSLRLRAGARLPRCAA